MNLLKHYRHAVKSGRLQHDSEQEWVVRELQTLLERLIHSRHPHRTWFDYLRHRLGPKRPRVEDTRGLYIWGSVGRGKTLLMDMFFHELPFGAKLRMHFHRFMQMIHGELRELEDTPDPLTIVADRIAGRARVICFDEFHVADITDAMLLGGLLKALFERGVVLVATSNTEPRYLYWGGLQRQRFLPAIELIEKHTRVIHMDGGIDHRLRFLDHAEIYHSPLDDAATDCLERNFSHLAAEAGVVGETIEIEGRSVQTVRHADGVVWFDFETLCRGPRGPADYIEIARTYQTVLLANVPRLGRDSEDAAKRFITLIDELYDRRVKLIMTAAELPHYLYGGERHAADFQRTVSRLHEMRSHGYLAGSHKP